MENTGQTSSLHRSNSIPAAPTSSDSSSYTSMAVNTGQTASLHRSNSNPAAPTSSDSPSYTSMAVNTGQTSSLHRSNSDPGILLLLSNRADNPAAEGTPTPPSSSSFHTAACIFAVYLVLTTAAYSLYPDGYKGLKTFDVIGALYYSIVTLCTIGYGDIVPQKPFAKFLSCLFILVGLRIVDRMLEAAVNCIFDAQKDRMRIRTKVLLAIGVVFFSIGLGMIALHLVEGFNWGDAFYVSVMSVTTVGYGDKSFNTAIGRGFASIWLLISTFAFARAVLYLTEARINKRHRRFVKWMLHRNLTVEDWYAADTDHNGLISKSEFVIYKLKQMGKVTEKDILEIYKQFSKLDPYNTGNLSLRIR